MSTYFSDVSSSGERRRHPPADQPQSYSWLRLLDTLLRWSERSQQRADLRDLNEHLLRDIGITRQEALNEADRPFWD